MSRHDHTHHHHHHGHDEHATHPDHHHAGHPHHEAHSDQGEVARGESGTSLSDGAKLIKVLEHWIHHNEDHAKSYGEWAGRARGLGEDAVGRILEEIAQETLHQNEKFREALRLMQGETAPR